MLFDFVSDINANEATENAAEDVDGAIEKEINREQEQRQTLKLNNVLQSESAGTSSEHVPRRIFRPFSFVLELLHSVWPMKTLVSSVQKKSYKHT